MLTPPNMLRIRPTLVAVAFGVAACGPGGGGLESADDETTSGATESESDSETETDTGDGDGDGNGDGDGDGDSECVLAIRIDLCCNQPYPAPPEEIGSEPCIVQWPIDWESIPDEVVTACTEAQADWCQLVDCTFALPASEVVEPDDSGTCQYVCPAETYLAYNTAGCGEPPPVVQCLGTPPPCADEYCSCEGETIIGCGQVSEPFAHDGPCP